MKNITLTKIPIGEGKEPCLNSKKIVLSLATISFLASCANAKLNSEIKTYDEVNKNVKTRSASVFYTNLTINSSIISKICKSKSVATISMGIDDFTCIAYAT